MVASVLSALMLGSVMQPAAAALRTEPDDTWMVDGPRVQEVVATAERVYVAGQFSTTMDEPGMEGMSARNLVAFEQSTGEPAWTATVGYASGDRAKIWDVEVSADGDVVYICGSFDRVGGATRSNVAALDASTGIVTPWAPSGVPICRSLVQAAGVLVVGGGLSLRALSPDGSTSWRTPTDGAVLTMVRNGGAVFVGGRFSTVAGSDRHMAAKVDPSTGAVSRGWTLDPVPAPKTSEGSFAIDLVVSGSALFLGAGGADYAARFNVASGALAWWTDTSGSVQALEVVDAGTLAIGGHFQWIADADTAACGTNSAPVTGCARRHRLAALDPTSGDLRSWDPSVTGRYTGVWSLDLDPSKRLHVGGAFTHIGDRQQLHYGRLSTP